MVQNILLRNHTACNDDRISCQCAKKSVMNETQNNLLSLKTFPRLTKSHNERMQIEHPCNEQVNIPVMPNEHAFEALPFLIIVIHLFILVFIVIIIIMYCMYVC